MTLKRLPFLHPPISILTLLDLPFLTCKLKMLLLPAGIAIPQPTPSSDPPPLTLAADTQAVIDSCKAEIRAAAKSYYASKAASRWGRGCY